MQATVAFPVLLALALGASEAPRLVRNAAVPAALLARASVEGKYEELLGTLDVPEDADAYGAFRDFGYWAGGAYKGSETLPPAHWVYVAPTWYLWARVATGAAASPSTPAAPRDLPRPHEGGRPRPDAERFDPKLAGELGPAYRYAREKGLAVGTVRPSVALPPGSLLPVVRTSDGGFFFSAHRDDRTEEDRNLRDRDGYGVYVAGRTVPLAVKLDASGALQWERALEKKGFVDYEFGVAAETPQRDLVVSFRCYVHPGKSPVHRFLKLTRAGSIVWERQLRGQGGPHTPAAVVARLTDRGSIALEGFIYTKAHDEAANEWRGEIGRDGKMLSDRVGPLSPPRGEGPVTFHPDLRSPGWLRDLIVGPPGPDVVAYRYLNDRWLTIAAPRIWRAKGQGYLTPVTQLRDGGLLVVAVKDERTDEERARVAPGGQPLDTPGRTAPVVLKLGASGALVWERAFPAREFHRYGGGEAIEAPDGTYLVVIPSFGPDSSWTSVPRFLKLSREGEVIWERRLPPDRWTWVEQNRLAPDGRLVSRGYTYAGQRFEKPLLWDGEVRPDGKLVDRVGGARPPPGTMQIEVRH